ncbi:MAG: penicillin-binding protein 2 [Chloroflexota bacterium]|nr:penicillin-binding protein 2 [Chloroflexota bacterium]MDE3193575.1 penicillin-binding protein 2 [Chloroflexota bacterium]
MLDQGRVFVHPRRLTFVAIGIVVMFVVLSVRLWDLQVVHGAYYRSLAEQNRIVRIPVLPDRGVIYDRTGKLLARNDPGFAVSVIPVDLPKAQEADVASRLAGVIGRGVDEITKAIDDQRTRNPYEPVKVSDQPLTRDAALLLVERAELYPGVSVAADALRYYPDPTLYSPIIGYVGDINAEEYAAHKDDGYLLQDTIGKTGLEWEYEKYLRGTLGWREVERDAAQRELRTLGLVPPKPGNDLVLTIDDKLQHLLAAELAKGVQDGKWTAAAGVAEDPQTGEVLALVSVPSFDNNAFVTGVSTAQMKAWNSDPRHPLVNKAIGDMYPPGSTFKLVTGLSALSTGVATRNTIVNVNSMVLSVDGYNFYDWRAHGPLDFIGGFANSSDIYFYTLGGGNPNTGFKGAGPDAIAKYGRMLGFGAPTGIDLPGEASGIMPDPSWKMERFGEPWTIGNTYQESIGQGYVAVTPIQLLNAYSAVANGGTLYRPHLLKEVKAPDGTVVYQQGPEVIRKLDVNPKDLELIREGGRRAVTIYHAYMPDAKLPFAGKTGTAEFGVSSGADALGRQELSFHNWFVSWVPDRANYDPTAHISMAIFLYDSSKSMCDVCLNPAVGITQRVIETYEGVSKADASLP